MLKSERIKTLKIIVIPFLILLIIFTVCLTGCGLQMKKYYNNDENYSTLNGLYLGIYKESFLYIKYSPYGEKETEYYFGGIEKTFQVLQDNGFFDEVPIDSEITFTTAFIVWCAGCRYCLAEVWYNGKCYLDFKTGKAIILQSIEEGRRRF